MRKYTNIKEPEASEILKKTKGFKTDIECPECTGILIVRKGSSKFLGCSNYPKCTCKIGISKEHELYPVHQLIKEMFSENNVLYTKNWEEVMDNCYPSGVNCSDDM